MGEVNDSNIVTRGAQARGWMGCAEGLAPELVRINDDNLD
jgi:hypothetical protein